MGNPESDRAPRCTPATASKAAQVVDSSIGPWSGGLRNSLHAINPTCIRLGWENPQLAAVIFSTRAVPVQYGGDACPTHLYAACRCPGPDRHGRPMEDDRFAVAQWLI